MLSIASASRKKTRRFKKRKLVLGRTKRSFMSVLPRFLVLRIWFVPHRGFLSYGIPPPSRIGASSREGADCNREIPSTRLDFPEPFGPIRMFNAPKETFSPSGPNERKFFSRTLCSKFSPPRNSELKRSRTKMLKLLQKICRLRNVQQARSSTTYSVHPP